MFPGTHAQTQPDKPAIIHAATGETITYRTLNERSNQIAQYLFRAGYRPGDHIAVLMENNIHMFEIAWAAMRSGLFITPINRHLKPVEAAYIVNDCGARVFFSSRAMVATVQPMLDLMNNCDLCLMLDGAVEGFLPFEAIIDAQPVTPLAEEPRGDSMLYSSGTTGRPKGIKRDLSGLPAADGTPHVGNLIANGFHKNCVYLSPAPIYHAAPYGYCMSVLSMGGTVVMMERFDAEEALKNIAKFRITHSQWVPTMFVRMLKLPVAVRNRYDLSSHELAVHAAAPCPIEIKQQMIDWWGPILFEYYAGSERNGSTNITSSEWLQRPGSVGTAKVGILRICDDEGTELPAGEAGVIYFEQDKIPFVYHNDPVRTKAAQHPKFPTWTTLGDVGYVDDEGYLFLTDRRSFMIISGGVNIYPRAIEDVLIMHPQVADVGVIGVPNADFGEEVKAIIQPEEGIAPSAELAEELIAFAHDRLAGYMVPRSVDFLAELPRLPTGKLYKNELRAPYWQDRKSKI